MRQLTVMFFFCVAIVATSAMSSNAQSRATYFSNGDSCEASLRSGSFNYYRPTYFGLHKKLSAGEEVRGLESDACVEMLTVKGYQWVIQKEGEKMVFKGLHIVRREDCGNPIRDIRHPKTAVEIPPAPKCPEGTYPSETPGVCIAEKEKIVTNTVKVEVEKPVYINPCPTDAEFDGTTSWKSRLGGGLVQAGISGGASILITKARGGDWDQSLKSGAYGVVLQRAQQLPNASEDGIRLLIPSLGIDQEISKGKNADLGNGVSVKWNGSRVALFRNLNGQSYRCDGFGLKKGSSLGIWTDGQSDGAGTKIPVKSQSPNQSPVRPSGGTPGVGTPLPVGNNGPVGGTVGTVPTRPMPYAETIIPQSTPLVNFSQPANGGEQLGPCERIIGGKKQRVC